MGPPGEGAGAAEGRRQSVEDEAPASLGAAWTDWYQSPFRGDRWHALVRAYETKFAAASAALVEAPPNLGRAAVLGEQLQATLALEFLRGWERRSWDPHFVVLLVDEGAMDADQAVLRLELASEHGRLALDAVLERLSADGMALALARIPWSDYRGMREVVDERLVDRACALGLAERLLGHVASVPERGRYDLMAMALRWLPRDHRQRALLEILDASRCADRFELLGRAVAVLSSSPADDRPMVLSLLGIADPVDEPSQALRRWIEPYLDEAWSSLFARSDVQDRLDGLELLVARLGPLLTDAESRRWSSHVLDVLPSLPGETYRLQVGVTEGALQAMESSLEALPVDVRVEALAWIGWGRRGRGIRRVFARWPPASELASFSPERRLDVLRLVLEAGDLDAAREAAQRVLDLPGCPERDMARAFHLLPGEARTRHVAARVAASLADDPLRTVAFVASLGAGLTGQDAAVAAATARHLWQRLDPSDRAAGLAEMAALLPADEVERWAEEAWVDGGGTFEDIGWLAPLLSPVRRAEVLALARERARTIDDPALYWDALRSVARGLTDDEAAELTMLALRERRSRGQAGAAELLHVPADRMDVEALRERLAAEVAGPANDFAAWRLGDLLAHVPPEERGPWLDVILDEFARIEATPKDPGNDLGPFTAVADWLDAPRVRRALAIVERMRAAAWPDDSLDQAVAYLLVQLARLGSISEAEEALSAIVDGARRAWVRGALWAWTGRPEHLPAKDADDEVRFEWLDGASRVDAAPSERVQTAGAIALGIGDERRRGVALQVLVEGCCVRGDTVGCVDLARAVPDQVSRVECLCGLASSWVGRDAEAARSLACEALALVRLLPEGARGDSLFELARCAAVVDPSDVLELWTWWLRRFHEGRGPTVLATFTSGWLTPTRGVDLFRWLGGSAAVRAGIEAVVFRPEVRSG